MTDIREKKITIRLPPNIHAQVTALADEDMRSLNAEVVVLLKEAIAARSRSGGDRRFVLEQRLHQLQLQADRFGAHTPPQIMLEIEDIRRQLASLDLGH